MSERDEEIIHRVRTVKEGRGKFVQRPDDLTLRDWYVQDAEYLRERVRRMEEALQDVLDHIVTELPRLPGWRGMEAANKAQRLLDAREPEAGSEASEKSKLGESFRHEAGGNPGG